MEGGELKGCSVQKMTCREESRGSEACDTFMSSVSSFFIVGSFSALPCLSSCQSLVPFSGWSCSSTRLVILPPEVTGGNPLWRFWIIYGGRNTFDHNFEMLCYICYRCRKAAFFAMRVLDNRPGQSCSKPSRVDNTGGLQLFVSKVFRTWKCFRHTEDQKN